MTQRQRVPRTRNGGRWTEAQYMGRIRSSLRLCFKWWYPATMAMQRAKIGPGRYKCGICGKVFKTKQIQKDHKTPCGTLRCLADIPQFIANLTPESPDAFQAICKGCHQKKTNLEREQRKEK